CTAYYYAMDYW
nr:immunoglobulin heavy chain junction region [Mus musculus]NSM05139.1 immunoglobulin heavy chain junction region [Mus musculus]NSM05476.1 immunoglobulin heavy chain junction region [Mus musculus]NSM06319.1 immunoglobulin heavy chain junction region [Mus musculus]NSM06351.1 immunoglobulin heavy chain junction region [Mus musculus]